MGSPSHNSGESGEWQMMNFQPMPLLKRPLPFDDPDWIYESPVRIFQKGNRTDKIALWLEVWK